MCLILTPNYISANKVESLVGQEVFTVPES